MSIEHIKVSLTYRAWDYVTHGFGVIKMNTNKAFTVQLIDMCEKSESLTTPGVYTARFGHKWVCRNPFSR